MPEKLREGNHQRYLHEGPYHRCECCAKAETKECGCDSDGHFKVAAGSDEDEGSRGSIVEIRKPAGAIRDRDHRRVVYQEGDSD